MLFNLILILFHQVVYIYKRSYFFNLWTFRFFSLIVYFLKLLFRVIFQLSPNLTIVIYFFALALVLDLEQSAPSIHLKSLYGITKILHIDLKTYPPLCYYHLLYFTNVLTTFWWTCLSRCMHSVYLASLYFICF